MISLDELNQQTAEDFTESLAEIFEHSPWVPAGAAALRPFESLASLHAAMVDVVAQAPISQKLNLLRAHPELAGREKLTAASAAEQGGKGLDRLTAGQAAQLADQNAAYRTRFGFPFIIAVRGQRDINMILDGLALRLQGDPDKEMDIALREVAKIAHFRLDDLLNGKS